MMKVKTINLSGKEYAQVKDRLKVFREQCPNGLIETTPTITETHIVFKARILRDKANPHSPEATGHSMASVKDSEKVKAFEKLESIAIGRALAVMGFMGDGEIASSEEMEEFIEYNEQKKLEALEEATEKINSCTSMEELKEVWTEFNGEIKVALEPIKESKKNQLNEKDKDGAKKPRVARVEKGENHGVAA